MYALACSTSTWSTWINEHKPSYAPFPEEKGNSELHAHETGGDVENESSLPPSFCKLGQGSLTKIECVSSTNGTDYTLAQQFKGNGILCDVAKGLKCVNRLTVAKFCLDYKVRYLCECTNPVGGSTTGPRAATSNPSKTSNIPGGVTGSSSAVVPGKVGGAVGAGTSSGGGSGTSGGGSGTSGGGSGTSGVNAGGSNTKTSNGPAGNNGVSYDMTTENARVPDNGARGLACASLFVTTVLAMTSGFLCMRT